MWEPLYTLVDSLEYVRNNCYGHQFSEALEGAFDVRYITMADLDFSNVPRDAHVLSRLRLRTAFNNVLRLRTALDERRVMIYDQDPWESFFVDAPYSGAYHTIHETLNVSTFLNISHWWRDRVREEGMPSEFVQVWTLPRYCRPRPTPWALRKHGAVFCGTMYPRRRAFFEGLSSLGVTVEVLPAGRSFTDYLDAIASAKVAIRSERVEWPISVAGHRYTITDPNALWKRDIETVAQGCFSMREWDDEGKLWGVGDIPSIVPFKDVEEAAEKLRWVLSLPDDVADDMAAKGTEHVRSAPGWSQACDVIKGVLGSG